MDGGREHCSLRTLLPNFKERVSSSEESSWLMRVLLVVYVCVSGQSHDVVHVSWTDITPIKRLMQMNKAVFESARSPMVVADEKGVILQVNNITSEVFGYTQASSRQVFA